MCLLSETVVWQLMKIIVALAWRLGWLEHHPAHKKVLV